MIRRLPLIATLSTYILIFLGVLVVGFDAGLACSDWPLCNGRIVPPMEGIILVEFTHRTFSSLTGLLIVWNAVVLWRNNPSDRLVRILAVTSVVLLILVAVMGGVNVLNKLPSGLTAIDMALAVLLLAVLVVLTVRVGRNAGSDTVETTYESVDKLNRMKGMYKPALLTAGAVYLETLVGGFLKHSSAAHTYVHPEAPLAKELVTTYNVAEIVMYVHMLTAFLVVLALFLLLVYARKQKVFFKQSMSILLLLGLQIFLGFFSLVTKLELLTTTAHMAVASAMVWISVHIAASAKFSETKLIAASPSEDQFPFNRTVVTNG
ncbi:COX15/CtaA family protein [Effusibacillus consociatus]|uniref:COX15/CtaA family protein n=1 Tax=Effusibacillus consociatus TaxID=1117041 RepID=A0ABV9PZU4_9BACL